MYQHSFTLYLLALLEVTSAQSPGEVACQFIDGVFNNCASQDSVFAQRPFSQRASCLCYEPTAWNPDNYDQPFRTCGSYIKTASPAAYASITSQNGPLPTAPCRDTGNVRNFPVKDNNQAACQNIEQLAAYCVANFPGYDINAPFPSQAPCLCYRNGNPAMYQGPLYDAAASSCLDYLQTALPSNYQQVVGPNGGKRPNPPCDNAKNNPVAPSTSRPVASTTPPTPGSSPSASVVVPTTTRPPTLTTTTSPPVVVRPSSSSVVVQPVDSSQNRKFDFVSYPLIGLCAWRQKLSDSTFYDLTLIRNSLLNVLSRSSSDCSNDVVDDADIV